jgi:hypothetical protein
MTAPLDGFEQIFVRRVPVQDAPTRPHAGQLVFHLDEHPADLGEPLRDALDHLGRGRDRVPGDEAAPCRKRALAARVIAIKEVGARQDAGRIGMGLISSVTAFDRLLPEPLTILFFGWFARVTFIPAIILVGFWFLAQLFSEVGALAEVQTGGVAYMAHIGGFIYGALAARFFESRERRWQQGLE